jgi:hypothetical protein
VADSAMTMPVHTMLAHRDLLPAEHLMDAGYPSTANLLACRTEHEVRLIAPMRGDSSRQARTHSLYARSAFTIDFDQKRATCPQGHHSPHLEPHPPGRAGRHRRQLSPRRLHRLPGPHRVHPLTPAPAPAPADTTTPPPP